MPARSIQISGLEVKLTKSTRRYVLVAFRSHSLQAESGWYVAFADTIASSDTKNTALAAFDRATRNLHGPGVAHVVIDSQTGRVVV